MMLSSSAHSQNCQDRYSESLVSTLLRLEPGVTVGTLEKQNQMLGDRVSIALIKAVGHGNLVKPQQVSKALPIIRNAFSKPELISSPEDRKPEVTLVLLEYMRGRTPAREVRRQIKETETYVKEKSARIKSE
jgi:hypothetical protein